MTGSQFDPALSEIARLLEQQRYEDALPLLTDLLEEDPSHREARTYRLLVVRILVLRHYLSERALLRKHALDRVAAGLASAARAVGARKLSRSRNVLASFTRGLLLGSSMFRITIAVVLGAALVTFLTIVAVSSGDGKPPQLQDAAFSSLLAAPGETLELRASEIGSLVERFDPASGPGAKKMLDAEALDAIGSSLAAPPRFENPAQSDFKRPVETTAGMLPASVQDASASRPSTLAARAQKLWPQYETLRSVSLRRSARFAAPVIRQIDGGMLVNVLEVQGSWARVRIQDEGVSGFVRREFLLPVAAASG